MGNESRTKELALPGETRVLSLSSSYQLKYQHAFTVTEILGVIGLNARASQGGDAHGAIQLKWQKTIGE